MDVTLCGGETADVGDLTQTLIVDSTVFCRLKKSDVIDCDNVRAGDVIVAFASHGKAKFEKVYNAGMGSNGLTAARHLLLSDVYRDKYPETYSPFAPKENVYCGKHLITDTLEGTDVNIGKAILSPTRPYAGLFPGAFCKVIADPAGSDDHCSALHADGAGTKSALAYLYWKETGDISVFEDLAQDALMMNIDDLACIGATDTFLLSNTIGRSAKNIPGNLPGINFFITVPHALPCRGPGSGRGQSPHSRCR